MGGRQRAPGGKGEFKGKVGTFSEERYAWTRTSQGETILYLNQDTDGGDAVRLAYNKSGARAMFIQSLTNLTEAELLATKQVIDLAFQEALPICQTRDKEAQHAFETNGDDSFVRLYREVPRVVVRERPKREHSEGVRSGSEGVHDLDSSSGDPAAGPGGSSDGLAQPVPEDRSASDNPAPPDLFEDLR